MGFLETLTLILVILKVLNVIHYSWLIVCAPLIGAVSLYVIIFILAMAFGAKIVVKKGV